MKFKDYVFGWSRMIHKHDTYVVQVGDRITSFGYPDIKKPLAIAIVHGYAGKTLKQLGFKHGTVCCYTPDKGFENDFSDEPKENRHNRLPLNPVFSKHLPLP